jgi:hypothetical protein
VDQPDDHKDDREDRELTTPDPLGFATSDARRFIKWGVNACAFNGYIRIETRTSLNIA